MKNLYVSSIILLQALFFLTARAQVVPCLTNPIFSDTCCPVLMNEILPEGYGGETWVELYSCRSDTVDLSGWFFTNNPTDSLRFQISSLLVPPQTFVVLELPFVISRSFGLLQMWRPDSTLAFGMTFDGVHVGESVGYCNQMITRQDPSPGFPNTCAQFMVVPEIVTEGKENNERYFYTLLGQRVFSPESGFFISVTKTNNSFYVRKCIRLP